MTTVTLKRTVATHTQESYPTKATGGTNPKTLAIFNNGSKELRTLVTFAVPAEVLQAGTIITSATLSIRNVKSSGGTGPTFRVRARRIIKAWTASKATWNATSGSAGFIDTTETSVAKTSSPAAGIWLFDVKAQMIEANAAKKFYGFELRTDTNGIGSWGRDARFINSGTLIATLKLDYTTGPGVPTQLSPSNGQVVSSPKPILHTFGSFEGELPTESRFQVNDTPSDTGLDYDSGFFPNAIRYLDLENAVAMGAPAFSTPLVAGAVTYWRMCLKDDDGTISDWTPWQSFTYQPHGVLTMTLPAAPPANQVTDPTPPVGWTFTGQTQKAFRVIFTDPSLPVGANVVWDSGVVTSTVNTITPPVDIASVVGHTYNVQLTVWDTLTRVTDDDRLVVNRDFTFELSAGVPGVTGLTPSDMDPLPFVKLEWSRSTAPDFFQIVRDGVSLGSFEAADLIVSGTSYAFIDTLAAPRREHTWVVRAVVNGETSAVNNPVTTTINPASIWLCDPATNRYLPFITQQAQAIGLSEDGATFNPLGSAYGVRVTGSLRGWSGSIVGEILATDLTGPTAEVTGSKLRDLFLDLREDAGEPMVLSILDMNIKVVTFNMTIAPTPQLGHNEDYVYAAQLEFIEVP